MGGIEDDERIRSNSSLFLVQAGHETLEVERVVVQVNGYLVVESWLKSQRDGSSS
jgi:hypothetical protein